MRHPMGATLLIMTLLACGGGEEAPAADAGTAEVPAQVTGSETADAGPACQPMSERLPLEGRASPYDSATIDLEGGTAKICYSRPSLKGRTMIGGDAVPYGELWRTGANEPTTLHVDTEATIAGVRVDAGSYSLYTVPMEEGPWTLIVNASTSQWGHEGAYSPEVQEQEVGRVEVETERVEEPIEQFTIRPTDAGDGVLLEWQNTRVRIPIQSAG